MNDLSSKIESILFVSNKPVTIKTLAKLLNVPEAEVRTAGDALIEARKNSGVVVLSTGNNYHMATHKDNTELVKQFLNTDLRERLTDATIEVLGIIAYRQPIAKSEIEAIRGVNSQYSIRQLLMRGLVEKVPGDGRSAYYQVTTEFLQHLGLTSVNDLQDFNQLVGQIKLPETPTTKPEEAPQN
jgi:segregation and condensation protein B